MAKFNKNNYNFLNLAENDVSQLSVTELDNALRDTKEILKMTKYKITKTIMNLQLVNGLVSVRGGEFKSINAFFAKVKMGSVTKEEKKLIKQVLATAKWYYRLKVIIVLITKNQSVDSIDPMLAIKK